MQEHVEIIEIGPREGIQNHPKYIDVESKVSFIHMLFDAGFRKIEVASFVHPKAIPQMKDGDQVLGKMKNGSGKIAQVLVPNETGCRNAIACGAQELVVWVYITDELNYVSQKRNRPETLKEINSIVQIAQQNKRRVSAWVAGAFGYPGLNFPAWQEVRGLAAKLIQLGCTEVCLSDEFCMANPRVVREYLRIYLQEIDCSKLLVHFHDNRGLGLANIIAAYEGGVHKFKACIGGAGRHLDLRSGNGKAVAQTMFPSVATEDLVFTFEEMGIRTGVDPNKLIECGRFAENLLERKLHSLVVGNDLSFNLNRLSPPIDL